MIEAERAAAVCGLLVRPITLRSAARAAGRRRPTTPRRTCGSVTLRRQAVRELLLATRTSRPATGAPPRTAAAARAQQSLPKGSPCVRMDRKAGDAALAPALYESAALDDRPVLGDSKENRRHRQRRFMRKRGSVACASEWKLIAATHNLAVGSMSAIAGRVGSPHRARTTRGGPRAASRGGWRASGIAGHARTAGSAGSWRHPGITPPPPPCSSYRDLPRIAGLCDSLC